MRKAAKVDKNQPEIVKHLRTVGAAVLPCHRLKGAFDLLVGFRGNLYMMEVKNPEYMPKTKSAQSALTQGEARCLEMFEAVGVSYHIVCTPEDALRIIGAI